MTVVLYACGSRAGANIFQHFQKGIPDSVIVPTAAGLQPGAVVLWGILRGSEKIYWECVKRQRLFYYIDHAYFVRGHENGNYRIAVNQTQTPVMRNRPPDRWDLWRGRVVLQPWQPAGRHVLVVPPTPAFATFFGVERWLADTLEELRRYTDRPLRIRTKKETQQRPLSEDLRDCHAVVTLQSNVAVDAIVAGVPAVVGEISAAAPVARTRLDQIERPIRPERKAWLRHLSYCQFSLSEMADGTAWRIVNE